MPQDANGAGSGDRSFDLMYPEKYMVTGPAKDDRVIGYKSVLQKMQQRASDMASKTAEQQNAKYAKPSSFKRGGKVQKTGLAKVHKGEKVLTRKQVGKSRSAHK